MSKEQARRSWEKFLNPSALRSNLITASLFLTAYELLQDSVVARIRDFFSVDFDENGGIASKDYKEKVLSLDRSPLKASLLWLREVDALSEADVAVIDSIRIHRNEIAHELPKLVMTADAEIDIKLLCSIHRMVEKIEFWWIKNVDIPTNTDLLGQQIDDADIMPGRVFCMNMMIKVAAEERNEDASKLWEMLNDQSG